MNTWIEIWGIEAGETEPALLYKIPANQWNQRTAEEYAESLNGAGTTSVEYRTVTGE